MKEFFDRRELERGSLEVHFGSRPDYFESAITPLIADTKAKLQAATEKLAALEGTLDHQNDPDTGRPSDHDMDIMEEQMEFWQDQMWLTEQLHALSEMKVIYLFKSMEIGMKLLIQKAYPHTNMKSFSQWTEMNGFFKVKSINTSVLTGYIEADQLRKVNNNIKHSDSLNEEVKKITEFVDKESFTYDDLERFFARIQSRIEAFQDALAASVAKERYDFDDNRIKEIAESFKDRMNKNTLKKLAAHLAG